MSQPNVPSPSQPQAQQPQAQPSAQQPQAAAVPQPRAPSTPAVVDPLSQLIDDVAEERKRMLAVPEDQLTLAALRRELADTNLDVLRDLMQIVRNLDRASQQRDNQVVGWSQSEMGKVYAHMRSLEERIEMDSFGGETQIMPEHAELLGKIVDTAQELAAVLLKGPPEQPEESKANLQQLITWCEEAKTVIEDATLVSDDDDDDDEGVPRPAVPGAN